MDSEARSAASSYDKKQQAWLAQTRRDVSAIRVDRIIAALTKEKKS